MVRIYCMHSPHYLRPKTHPAIACYVPWPATQPALHQVMGQNSKDTCHVQPVYTPYALQSTIQVSNKEKYVSKLQLTGSNLYKLQTTESNMLFCMQCTSMAWYSCQNLLPWLHPAECTGMAWYSFQDLYTRLTSYTGVASKVNSLSSKMSALATLGPL